MTQIIFKYQIIVRDWKYKMKIMNNIIKMILRKTKIKLNKNKLTSNLMEIHKFHLKSQAVILMNKKSYNSMPSPTINKNQEMNQMGNQIKIQINIYKIKKKNFLDLGMKVKKMLKM